jgi:hypothetical protein
MKRGMLCNITGAGSNCSALLLAAHANLGHQYQRQLGERNSWASNGSPRKGKSSGPAHWSHWVSISAQTGRVRPCVVSSGETRHQWEGSAYIPKQRKSYTRGLGLRSSRVRGYRRIMSHRCRQTS